MPSSFARVKETEEKFVELLALLNELAPPGKGQPADRWAELIEKVEEAQAEFVALGGPQSGSSG